MPPIVVIADPDHDEHIEPSGHPERVERIPAVLAGLRRADLLDASYRIAGRPAGFADLRRVHTEDYVLALEHFCLEGGGALDADTYAEPGSWPTALAAAGSGLVAIDELREGRAEVAMCVVRPPGHHARRANAMGFCLLNNVAVAAAALRCQGERVVIVDWDVHHGNGTQEIFYDDPDVLYVSTHQANAYPGTGHLHETGGPNAPMSNLNLPLPAGATGDVLAAAFDEVILPALEAFSPTWLLVSAGFDAHRDDPLADLALTAADFADSTQRLMAVAGPGRTIFMLEGGYDLRALADSTGATLAAAIGERYRPESPSAGGPGALAVEAARQLWFSSN